MRNLISIIAISILPITAVAQGDVATGEKDFRKCKSCHTIASADEVIVKGGRTGPNLYGIVGRIAGSADFRYSKDMIALRDTGFIWTEEEIVKFVANPSEYLAQATGNPKARSKMTQKMRDAEDITAYLASLLPPVEGQ